MAPPDPDVLAGAVSGRVPRGNSYVTGWTYSDDFPVLSAIQPVRGGRDDAFATKLNPGLTGLAYSTYFGGSRTELGHGVAVDAAGNLAIVGATVSDDLPTANAFQPARAGSGDGFVAKLSPSGSAGRARTDHRPGRWEGGPACNA